MTQQTKTVDLRQPAAFKQMYREELRWLVCVLNRLGAPPAQIEDLCHEVFLTAFRKREDYDPARPLRPWLFGIAFRQVLNVRRKTSMPGDDASLSKLADTANGPEEAMHQSQARTQLHRAIQTLEPDRRAVFLLHDVEGQPAPEIARTLEIPLNTAYSRLRLARADILRVTEGLREGGAR